MPEVPSEGRRILEAYGLPVSYSRWYLWKVWSRRLIDLYNDAVKNYLNPSKELVEDLESRLRELEKRIAYDTPSEFPEKFPYSTLYWVQINPEDYERADKRTFGAFPPLLPDDTFADVMKKIRIILDSYIIYFKYIRSYSTGDKNIRQGGSPIPNERNVEMQLLGYCTRKDRPRVEEIAPQIFNMLEGDRKLSFLSHIPKNEPGLETEYKRRPRELKWFLKVYDYNFEFSRVEEERIMPKNWAELSDGEILEIFADFDVKLASLRGKKGLPPGQAPEVSKRLTEY